MAASAYCLLGEGSSSARTRRVDFCRLSLRSLRSVDVILQGLPPRSLPAGSPTHHSGLERWGALLRTGRGMVVVSRAHCIRARDPAIEAPRIQRGSGARRLSSSRRLVAETPVWGRHRHGKRARRGHPSVWGHSGYRRVEIQSAFRRAIRQAIPRALPRALIIALPRTARTRRSVALEGRAFTGQTHVRCVYKVHAPSIRVATGISYQLTANSSAAPPHTFEIDSNKYQTAQPLNRLSHRLLGSDSRRVWTVGRKQGGSKTNPVAYHSSGQRSPGVATLAAYRRNSAMG
jgi:hypothetical protein